ncbi:hypothetical protein J5N97_024131 [Dioscorea zingiberensis]|uniref:Uncharacterized protein n=1 Tax=Dioscorea zingiberensis TaxID=325984 RepID=A0A9D5C6W5_9LILI|nr:hypothetical protein J5N97_024131 [Dioscorea zingiberensis]
MYVMRSTSVTPSSSSVRVTSPFALVLKVLFEKTRVESLAGNSGNTSISSTFGVIQNEASGTKNLANQSLRVKSVDGRSDQSENGVAIKSDSIQQKTRAGLPANGPEGGMPSPSVLSGTSKASMDKNLDEVAKVSLEEALSKASSKFVVESESRAQLKHSVHGSTGKLPKQELVKEDVNSGKMTDRITNQLSSATADGDSSAHSSENRQNAHPIASTVLTNSTPSARTTVDMHGSSFKMHEHRASHSPISDDLSAKQHRRIAFGEEQDKLNKRRKGDAEGKDANP